MSFRKTVFVLALVGASIPVAFANSGVNSAGGEKGFDFHDTPSLKSRADVQKELEDYRKNPTTTDGGKLVAWSSIYIFPQHRYDFKDGKAVHTDTLNGHDSPKPSLTLTADERVAKNRMQGM